MERVEIEFKVNGKTRYKGKPRIVVFNASDIIDGEIKTVEYVGGVVGEILIVLGKMIGKLFTE